MQYTHEDFIRLLAEIEEQGGTHVDETCMKDEIDYRMPDGKTHVAHTTGCEDDLLFDVPYDLGETVIVEEPILIADPSRPQSWFDHTGVERFTTCSVKDGHGNVKTELVEREGIEVAGDFLALNNVRVCARDDNVGMWPRFRHVIKDQRSR